MNTKPMSFRCSIFVSVIVLLCLVQIGYAQKFTIPVLPDTQREINSNPAMFISQMQWLVSHKDSLNIPIVLHVGDVVDFDNHDHYKRASEGFSMLDRAKIPYAITLGNHDTEAVGEFSGSAAPGNVNANLRKTTKFNTYFPVKRFTLQKDRFEKDKSDNATYTFKAGGLNWLVLTLEFCARQEPVNWANQMIAKYPKHNVIVLTHFHLTSKGEIAQNNAGYGNLTIQSIYDQLIKQHSNILMVLSGHVGTSAYRIDQGIKGNQIYQMLQDYQGEDLGGGYIRLLEIDPEAKTISAKMYSPYYKTTKTDASQFSFQEVKFTTKKIK